MKCSKCGTECKDNQAFCLNCGAPIQVVPDFNLMEAELASNVGEMINQMKRDDDKNDAKQDDISYLDDEHYSDDTMPTKPIDVELGLNEFEQMNSNKSSKTSQKSNNRYANNFEVNGFSNDKSLKETNDDEKEKEKKIFIIKISIICVCLIIAVIGAIVLLNNMNNKSNNNFVKKYNAAYDYFSSKEYQKAIDGFIDAKEVARSNDDKIKVDKSLLSAYEKLGNSDDKMIVVLKELIELQPSVYENYEKLIKIYDSKNMTEEIEELMSSITDINISSKLSDYSVATPSFSQDEGEYDSYISLSLSSTGNNVIYYTIDGTEPTLQSTEYSDSIKLNKAGNITVKAIAVNDRGISSKVVTKTYKINPSKLDEPQITPNGGTYSSEQKITVNVPEGAKCYYTYEENAKTPTDKDIEYKEPISMKRGKNIFCAILVSSDGKVSDVVQNIYQLNIERTIQYSDALDILKKYMTDNTLAWVNTDNQYMMYNGSSVQFSYNCLTSIDDNEYYVINVQEVNTSGTVVETKYYGVDTVTGTLKTLIENAANSGEYIITE